MQQTQSCKMTFKAVSYHRSPLKSAIMLQINTNENTFELNINLFTKG